MVFVVKYEVDHRNKLRAIEGPWDEFARENGGPGALKEVVLGHSIFKFIAGRGMRGIYDAMHKQAFDGKTFRFRYRCDSPELRRDMLLSIESYDGFICYESRMLRVEPHPVPIILPQVPAEHLDVSKNLIQMCSFCKSYKLKPSHDWKPLERIITEELPLEFDISHGICGECAETYGKPYGGYGLLLIAAISALLMVCESLL